MPLQPSTTARLDHLLATAQRDGRLPSVAAGLVRGGELVWSGAAGTVDGRAEGRPRRRRHPVPDGLDHQDLRRRVRAAAARRRAARAHRPVRRPRARAPPSTTSPSSSCSPTPRAPRPRPVARGGSARPAATGTSSSPRTVGQRFRAGRRFHYSNVGYAALGRLLEVAHGARLVRRRARRAARAARHDPHHDAPVGVGGARPGRAPLRRPAAARARARRRRDGPGRPALDHGHRPGPLGDVPRRRDGRAAVRRHLRRDGRAAPRRRRPRPAVGGRARPGRAGVERRRRPLHGARRVDAGLPRRHPGQAGCRCAGGRFGCRFRWERRPGIRPGGRSGR